jgi:hypothetical protein
MVEGGKTTVTDSRKLPGNDSEQELETFPVEPRYHPIHRLPRMVYDFLASAKLAMFLLVVILVCCLAGTTVFRDKRAWEVIFSALWFNGLLVLLIINVACCFFGRVWGRRLTVISAGMILFHLSFVAVFAGIIYNSLFYFRGTIRLTEGETLPNGNPKSYDTIDQGRFFTFSKLKGETSLLKMHTGFQDDGKNKRAAYEVEVGYAPQKIHQTIYVTKNLEYRGFRYFPDREGYSALVILYDRSGNEIYGAHVPLQSLKQQDSYLYTTGTKEGPLAIPFPQNPVDPRFTMNLTYMPDPKKERGGEVRFQLYPLTKRGLDKEAHPTAAGDVPIGSRFDGGEYSLAVREIRYWTVMAVRYEPGQPIILTSLWVGLFGVTLTTVARIFRKKQIAGAA